MPHTAHTNDGDERRSRQRQRGGGRRAERGQSNGNAKANGDANGVTRHRSKSRSRTTKTDTHVPVLRRSTASFSSSASSQQRRRGHVLPQDYIAPPPPPPPPPGRHHALFHSVAAVGKNGGSTKSRGRSLSIARSSSGRSGRQSSRTRHLEDKGGVCDKDKSNLGSRRCGRSLSLAHQSKSNDTNKPSSSSRDGRRNGRHRSRSRSKSRGRNDSRSKSRGGNNRRAHDDDVRASFRKLMAENSASQRSHGKSSKSRRSASASTRGRRSASRSSRGATANDDAIPSSTAAATGRPSASRARPVAHEGGIAGVPSPSRKFVVEIGSNDEVVQVFEFSDSGSLPPPKTNDDDGGEGTKGADDSNNVGNERRSKEEILIEDICSRYSAVRNDSLRSKKKKDHSAVAKVGQEDEEQKLERSGSDATRKIVVDIDGSEDQIDDNNAPPAAASRDESPFSNGANPSDGMARDGEEGPDERKASQQIARRRSASAPRARPTLRSSLRGSKTVSFVLDDDDDDLDNGSDRSLEWPDGGNAGGGGDRSPSFVIGRDEEGSPSGEESEAFVGGAPEPDVGEKNDESEISTTVRRSVSFISSSSAPPVGRAHAAPYPPPSGRKAPPCALDASERSGKSSLDASDRSDAFRSRRSVSFLVDQEQDEDDGFGFFVDQEQDEDDGNGNRTHGSSAVPSNSTTVVGGRDRVALAYDRRQTRGRSATEGGEDPREVRRVRSLSRIRAVPVVDDGSSIVIDDSSLLIAIDIDGTKTSSTPPRGRPQAVTGTDQDRSIRVPPRHARSLSRTRFVPPIRNHVDFDPPPMAQNPGHHPHQQQDNNNSGYNTIRYSGSYRRGALPHDMVPSPISLQKPAALQKSQISQSTEETFVSALTIDTQDSFFTNRTSRATRGDDDEEKMVHTTEHYHPFLNSTLTIFESECDDNDDDDVESLLSEDLTALDGPEPGPPAREGGSGRSSWRQRIVKEENTKPPRTGEALKQEERRSRIRRMLSRKASSKRGGPQQPPAKIQSSNPSSLDISEETRVTLGTEGSGPLPERFIEGAQNSLLHHHQQQRQQHHAHRSENIVNHRGSSSSDSNSKHHKSRLSRLLKR